MEILLFWLLFSMLCGLVASSRGRSGFGYFVLAIIISPLLCIILVALMPSRHNLTATPDTHVKCPDCREIIPRDACVCKHCGCRLRPQ